MCDFPPESADGSYEHLISKRCRVNPCKLVVRSRATQDEDVCYEFVGEAMNDGGQIRLKPSVRRRPSVPRHYLFSNLCDVARGRLQENGSVDFQRGAFDL